MAMGLSDSVPPRSLLAELPGPVWGIDPSTQRVSVGIVSPTGITAHTLSLTQGGAHAGVRLARAMPDLQRFFARLGGIPSRSGTHVDDPALMPVAIAVEEPFGGAGTGVPVDSYILCGVVLAALAATFGERPVLLRQWQGKKRRWSPIGVGPSSWKARALGAGHGRAKKPEIEAWARAACGWDGPSPTRPQDESDALAIATWAAMETIARGQKDESAGGER
jgi:Holliday junction resolvasome RuvABC endonuclease subunit